MKIVTPDINGAARDQWLYLALSFGLSKEDVSAELPQSGTRVVIQPADGHNVQGTVSLVDFVHPEDAVYIFGGDDGFMEPIEADHYVYIPTPPTWELYASQAGAIVIWDRTIKNG